MYTKENKNHIYKDGTVMCVYIDLHRYIRNICENKYICTLTFCAQHTLFCF